MTSLILATATRYLMPVLLLFSIFLLLRGHNEPGGGFLGGLMAAAAFSLYALAYSPGAVRHALRVDPRTLIGLGLLAAGGSGVVAVVEGLPYLTGRWTDAVGPVLGKLGTPLLFDVGVYLVVVGAALTIVLELMEE